MPPWSTRGLPMRLHRKAMSFGPLMAVIASVRWRKCSGLRMWRRRSRAARVTQTSSNYRQLQGCGRVILIFMAVLALASPTVAAEPARVTLAVHAMPVGGAHVTATVTDARSSPVEGVPVTLRVKTTFGWLIVAKGRTDLRGQIHVLLPASSRFEEIAAEAGDAETVQAAVRLVQGQSVAPIVRPGYDALVRLSPQPGFISPYPVPLQVFLLTVILGGIWATYGYVVSLLAQIRRVR